MPLDASPEFKARLAREDLTTCRLFTIVLRNGETYRYTTLDEDVLYFGELYRARPGINISAIRKAADAKQETTTVEIGFYEGMITEVMTKNNALDGATFSVLLMDYLEPTIRGMMLQEGDVYNVAATNNYTAKLACGSYAGATVQIGEQYSMKCRNVFGDEQCKVDVEQYSKEFTVISVNPNQVELSLSTAIGGGQNPVGTDEPAPGQIDLGPGAHALTVPAAGIVMTIVATSGSGGAGSYCYRINAPDAEWDAYYGSGTPEYNRPPRLPAWLHRGANGTDGGDTVVGPMTIKGGKGGLGSNLNAYQFNPSMVRDKGIADPSVINSTVAELGGGPAGGKSYREINIERIINLDTRGQDGGRGSKGTLVLVSGLDVMPGDAIAVTVGAGGQGGVADYGPSSATDDEGAPGHVTVTFSANPPVNPGDGSEAAFDQGSIVWLNGRNAGDVASIAATAGASVTLTAPMSYPIYPGDRGKFRAGCSYYANMCEERYNNLVNMEAEPAVPLGVDSGTPTPNTGTVDDPAQPPAQGVDPFFPITNSYVPPVTYGGA